MTSAFNNPSSLTTILRSGKTNRSRSYDSLHMLDLPSRKLTDISIKAKEPRPRSHQDVVKSQQVSRLELLLVPRATKPVFKPEEQSTASQRINHSLKLSSQWTEVQQIVLEAEHLTASNLAFALYRLGCLAAFDSKKRVSDLKHSKLVPQIFDLAIEHLHIMEPASLVLLLDACARLQHFPSEPILSMIAVQIQNSAEQLDARQLPLVLWAFSSLQYKPRPEVLSSLENAVYHLAPELSPQGLALVLGSFNAVKYRACELTMTRLADIIQRQLLLFKPSELATCLKAMSAVGYKPTPTFLQALSARTGEPHSQKSRPFAARPKLVSLP